MFAPLFSFFNEKECVWVENMTQALNRGPPPPHLLQREGNRNRPNDVPENAHPTVRSPPLTELRTICSQRCTRTRASNCRSHACAGPNPTYTVSAVGSLHTASPNGRGLSSSFRVVDICRPSCRHLPTNLLTFANQLADICRQPTGRGVLVPSNE